ncbi:hypothetical protein D3C76_31790 [compost metagenome]
MPRKKRTTNKTSSINANNTNSLIAAEITSDDLEIIGSGLAVLSELFTFLSLVKIREEELKATEEEKNP